MRSLSYCMIYNLIVLKDYHSKKLQVEEYKMIDSGHYDYIALGLFSIKPGIF